MKNRLKNRLRIRLRLNFDSMTCINYLFLDIFHYRKSQADSQADSQAVFQAVFFPSGSDSSTISTLSTLYNALADPTMYQMVEYNVSMGVFMATLDAVSVAMVGLVFWRLIPYAKIH